MLSYNLTSYIDQEMPVFQCPEDNIHLYVEDAASTVEVTWEDPPVTDNSGDAPTLTSSRTSGDAFGVGVFLVEYEATDRSGNTAVCLFQIIVEG